jgi:hypothetical protein
MQFLVLLMTAVNSHHQYMSGTGVTVTGGFRNGSLQIQGFTYRDYRVAQAIKFCMVARIVCVEYGTCFLSPIWRLELEVTPRFSEIFCTPIYI